MNLKLLPFARLLTLVKDTLNKRPPFYIHVPGTFGNVEVPAGGCVLILPDNKTYLKLIDGLYLAEMQTGIDYNNVMDKTLVISN